MPRLVISDHARFEMRRRRIPEEAVRRVALMPEQVVSSHKGTEIRQSRVDDHAEGKRMLLRVVVAKRHGALFVVTTYKTSNIGKYWRTEADR